MSALARSEGAGSSPAAPWSCRSSTTAPTPSTAGQPAPRRARRGRVSPAAGPRSARRPRLPRSKREPGLAFLRPALDAIASPTIRNMATVGGNLFVKQPYGDLAACLIALGAEAPISGRRGRRGEPVETTGRRRARAGRDRHQRRVCPACRAAPSVSQGRPQGAELGGDRHRRRRRHASSERQGRRVPHRRSAASRQPRCARTRSRRR